MTQAIDTAVEPTVLEYHYDAPKELVFDAWTLTEHLEHWNYPFPGFTCEYQVANIEPGGSSLHKMTTPHGIEIWLLTKYDDIVPPERIVFRQYMSNQNGDILPNPQMPNWPKEMRTTVDLFGNSDKTRLTLTWEPIDPTEDEAQTFELTRTEHDKGWMGGLNNLSQYLQTLE